MEHVDQTTLATSSSKRAMTLLSAAGARDTQRLLRFVILTVIAGAAISARLFSIVRFESIIHEFDPWFNFRATKHFVK
jgi:dolichyl-diphosphooligosaccharide--protein glycosyltransferase